MLKKIFLIIILTTFLSCEKSEFENLLINPNKKWSYVSNNKFNKNMRIVFYSKFYPNGDYENLFIETNEKHILLDGNSKDCHWKYSKKDSILELCERTFKIFKYEKDTIHLLELKDNFRSIFINYSSKEIKN